MADSSHLEKMGRELKCPICLSLVDSAVSLTCNHVFCNSCIHKSMKSGANCPVCKVPFQRREIRPAPHMDNLVNIYKNMEVASGLTLFVTPKQCTTKLPDAQERADGDLNSGGKDTCGETLQTAKNNKNTAGSSDMSRPKAKCTSRERGKSSFSMTKRVQLPESPSTETPLRQAISDLGKSKMIANVVNKIPVLQSEHPLSNGKGSPNLSPFFWLGENVEKSSQETDIDNLTCTPSKAPSFSDLKDSDDDVPSKLSPKESRRNCDNLDNFDSEMFEWTQRACSPELCASPINLEAGETAAAPDDVATDRELIADKLDDVSPQDKIIYEGDEFQNNTCPESSREGCKLPQKRGRKRSKSSQNKRQVKLFGRTGGKQDGYITSNYCELGQESDDDLALRSSKPEGTLKTKSVGSLEAALFDERDDPVLSKLVASSARERGNNADGKSKTLKRNTASMNKSRDCKPDKRVKEKQKLAKPDTKEAETSCGDMIVNFNSLDEISVEKPCNAVQKSVSGSTGCINKVNCQRGPPMIEEKAHANDIIQEKMAVGDANAPVEAAADAQVNNAQIISHHGLGAPLKKGKFNLQTCLPTLRKCCTSSIKCTFCHSTEETKASGEMVHYSQGKSVPATHSGGSVIHCHKNCAEWAPNVYFEDDTAVNLEEELARSRRIRCSLCGVKGAALGCYEKSCRKSFHVPCAKRLRECRWDKDHFVILCPLHASSKLPCEMPTCQGSQAKKRKHDQNSKLLRKKPSVSVGRDSNTSRLNCGRPSEKIVLCCSALATGEKVTVMEFAKSSGLAVEQRWNPSVTHVIASTNENGACKRTLKFLLGILEGKWVLSINWVHACIKASRLVEETAYEITCDTHGIKNGPRLGRLRLLNKRNGAQITNPVNLAEI